MRKVIITAIIALLVVCGVGAVINSYKTDLSNSDILMRATIYPVGTGDETYCFTLNQSNELTVEKGTRRHIDEFIKYNSYIKEIVASENITLSDSEASELINIADKTTDMTSGNKVSVDTWEVQLMYKGKVIKHDYDIDIPPELRELIDKFIEISPIEVDIHGWA